MKLKNLIAFISFTAFTTLVSSCGDSYMPITLVSLDGNTTYSNNDTISLVKFTEGEEFNIKGGDGKYSIEVKDKSNNEEACIDDVYSFSNNVLTLKPKTEGECFLYVNDTEKNSTRILVQVKNMDRRYIVNDIIAYAEGDGLTLGEKKQIEEDMLYGSFINVGGKFEFTYTTKDFNNGTVKIYTSENNSDTIDGFFNQEEKFDEESGNKIITFKIYYSLGGHIDADLELQLSESKDGENNQTIISQDLTDEYKIK